MSEESKKKRALRYKSLLARFSPEELLAFRATRRAYDQARYRSMTPDELKRYKDRITQKARERRQRAKLARDVSDDDVDKFVEKILKKEIL